MAEGDLLKPGPGSKLPTLDWAKFTWEALKGVAAASAAVFAMYANSQSNANGAALSALKLQADTRAQQSALDIRVYELVEKALSLEGPAARGHGVAAAALINALTNPPLRDQLLNALRAGSNDEALIKQLDATLEFDTQAETPSPPANRSSANRTNGIGELASSAADLIVPSLSAQGGMGALKGYHIDVLFCEAGAKGMTDARKRRADAAVDKIKANGSGIDARARMLPSLVQARPEYHSYADEVRYPDTPRDAAAAKSLASVLAIPSENVRRANSKPTPNYLSVFYCASQ